jgi:hypothetical protein
MRTTMMLNLCVMHYTQTFRTELWHILMPKKQEIARTLISNPEVSEEPSEEEVENS